VSGAPDEVSDDELPIPLLLVSDPLSLLPVLLLPLLLTVKMNFLFGVSRAVLLCLCVLVMLQFLSCAPVFLAIPPPSPLLLVALNLPRRLVAAADALLGMVNTDLLLLLLTFGRKKQKHIGLEQGLSNGLFVL
jgi:hypothetical protein